MNRALQEPAATGVLPAVVPSLDHLTPEQWRQAGELAYLFARRVRHDLVNLHASTDVLEMVEQMSREADPAAPASEIPPELDPQRLRQQAREDGRRIISCASDMALLSQSGNAAAYRALRHMKLEELIEDAISSRLRADDTLSAALSAPPAETVACLDDTLSTALAVCYFQWSPSLHAVSPGVALRLTDNCVIFNFRADDTDAVTGMAKRLEDAGDAALARILEHPPSASTTELALWLARTVVMIHGGTLQVHAEGPGLALCVTLPLAIG